MSDLPEAWDQICDASGQPIESAEHYQAFEYYRELGVSRTLAAVSRAVGRSYGAIYEWSRQWFWEDRVRDFDAAQKRARTEAYERARAQAAERWAQQQTLIQDLAAEAVIHELQGLRKRQLTAPQGVTTPAELARLFKEINHQGDLMAGKPTEILTQEIDLDKLSSEERATLRTPEVRAALEKIAKG